MTSYLTLYERALSKITDPALAMLPEEDLENMLYGWLMSAVAKMRKCSSDLTDRDEDAKQFNADLTDIEKEILAILMTREWLAPQLTSVLTTSQVFSGKETKFFAQANHLNELQTLDERLKLEAQQLSRDYSYANSDYFD